MSDGAIQRGMLTLENNFHRLLTKLLRSLNIVFPECERVLAALLFVKGVEGDNARVVELLDAFHDASKPYFDGLKAGDEGALLNACESISYLRDLEMATKFNDPDFTESRPVLFKYVNSLVMYCRMYKEVDRELMRAVQDTAHELAADIKHGRQDINGLDLEQIGIKAIRRLNTTDTEQELLVKVNHLLELLTDNPMFSEVIDEAMARAGVQRP